MFLLRATSPCLLSEVQLCWLVLSVGRYLGGPLNLGTVWATWALSAVSSQWRIHGCWAFAGPASTSPWFSSCFLAFLLCEFSLSNLLHTYFFMQLCWWQLERDGDIAFTFIFDLPRSKGLARTAQMSAVSSQVTEMQMWFRILIILWLIDLNRERKNGRSVMTFFIHQK